MEIKLWSLGWRSYIELIHPSQPAPDLDFATLYTTSYDLPRTFLPESLGVLTERVLPAWAFWPERAKF